MKVPQEIVNAVNVMLAPYGETYTQGGDDKPRVIIPHRSRGYVSVGDASEYLGVSRSTFLRMVKDGKIPFFKIGNKETNGKVIYALDDIERYIATRKVYVSAKSPKLV